MDENEFKIKVFAEKDAMYRFALSLLKNESDAMDVTQEVLLSLWKRRSTLVKLTHVKAFIMKSIKNKCLDLLRFSKKFSDETQTVHRLYHLEKRMETLEQVEIIKEIISTLPEKQRMVLHLRDVEGYSFKEIETVLEIEYNAIRTNLSRGRKTVREQYHRLIVKENEKCNEQSF